MRLGTNTEILLDAILKELQKLNSPKDEVVEAKEVIQHEKVVAQSTTELSGTTTPKNKKFKK